MWIIYSLISLVSLAIMIVVMTSQTKKGVSVEFTLAIVVGLWIPFYALLSFFEGFNLPSVSMLPPIIMALISVGILAVIANSYIFKAYRDAQNPGLAAAIVNTNPVIITIFAGIFLDKELTIIKLLGILICVIGVIIINLVTSKSKEAGGKKWFLKALIALILAAIIGIIISYIIDMGMSVSFSLLVVAMIGTPIYIIWAAKKGLGFSVAIKRTVMILFLAGILSVIGNWAAYMAATVPGSPNYGYAFAISGSKPALIILLAHKFLKSELTLKQLVGVIICVVGIIIIVL